MLTITQALFDQIVAHAREDHPDEACGVVAGPEGSGRPERFIPMLNAARSPTFYEFDSGDLLKLYRELDDRDEEPVIIYHSHTATEAYPSRTDVSYANEPGAHYVLVSTADTDDAGPLPVPLVPHRGRRDHRRGREGRRGVLSRRRGRPTSRSRRAAHPWRRAGRSPLRAPRSAS
ncbi:UNVERIFIED_CONTAM: proteasome lid subunit RPN8/RPN11 [Streptomyces graminofaciens]